MQSPEVKQTAVKTVADVYNTVILEVLYVLLGIMPKKHAEQSRCQNTTLFHAVDDGEGSREVAVQPNLAALVYVQLDNHPVGLWGAAKTLHGHSQSLFSSLCQTLWSGPQMLHTVLCSAPCISFGVVWGRTPCLWWPCWLWTHTGFLIDGLYRWWVPICLEVHEQGFFCDGEQSDPPLVGAIWLLSLVFVQGDDDCIAEITWKLALLPTTDNDFVELTV